MRLLFFFLILLPFCGYAQIHIAASDTTVCNGTRVVFSVTDTGSATAHFNWMLNGNYVGTDTSVYITDTLNNGDSVLCKRTNAAHDTVFAISDAIVMVVDTAIPDAGIITGTVSRLCVGTSTLLTDTTSGGIWGATNEHATVTDGTVVAVYAGLFECPYPVEDTLYYVVYDGGCSDTAFYTMTIEPKPYAYFDIVKPYLCGAEPLTIIGPPCGGTYDVLTYSDKRRDNWNIFGVSTNFCGSDTTKYYKSVTRYKRFYDDTPVISLTVDEMCQGGSVVLSATGDPNWLGWYSNSRTLSFFYKDDEWHVSGTKVGLDTITVTWNSPCGSMSPAGQATIRINPQPQRDSITWPICIGEETRLENVVPGGEWQCSDPTIAVTDPTLGKIMGISVGSAIVTYTHSSGCFGTRKLSIADCDVAVSAFPNPATNTLVLNHQAGSYDHCAIINDLGITMLSQQINETALYTVLDVSTLPPGIYITNLTGEKGSKKIKFRKQY